MASYQASLIKALQFAVVFNLIAGCKGILCKDIVGSGCSGSGNVTGDSTFGVVIPPLPPFNLHCSQTSGTGAGGWETSGGTNGCDTHQADYDGTDCLAFIDTFDEEICGAWLLGCCTAGQTLAPTNAPSDSPTESPTLYPSKSPTESPSPFPTQSPTSTPTGSPSTSPTSVPTASPVTGAPVKAPPAFFEDPNNIYIVAGSSGGGLLLAAALVLLLRSRGKKSSKPATKALETKGALTEVPKESDIFDWEKHIDKKSGEVYFFNVSSAY